MEPETFKELVEQNLKAKCPLLTGIISKEKLVQETFQDYEELRAFFSDYMADTPALLQKALAKKENVLFEGAQGTMLDVDFATFPFVTSSNPIAGAACVGSGVGPNVIEEVLGVVKAYTTRVGDGPFPTELNDAMGAQLRERGAEFGATTGRPRRCGWFDAVVMRHAVRINGLTRLALTKLDVLEGVDPIRVCVAYKVNGKTVKDLPASRRDILRAEPVYRNMKGFEGPVKGITQYKRLPKTAQAYVQFLAKEVGAPVSLISMGRSREETIVMDKKFKWVP
jgi:adenylosuccinate synthase